MSPRPHWPFHNLDAFREDFFSRCAHVRVIHPRALEGATSLGLGPEDIAECIKQLTKRADFAGGHFVQTNHYKWPNGTPNSQDEYHIRYEDCDIYLKLGRDPDGNPIVVSFKEHT